MEYKIGDTVKILAGGPTDATIVGVSEKSVVLIYYDYDDEYPFRRKVQKIVSYYKETVEDIKRHIDKERLKWDAVSAKIKHIKICLTKEP